MFNIVPVILSGGSGSRLWPDSRESHPKQYLNFISKNTLLEETLNRFDNLKIKKKIIVCNHEHRFFVEAQCSLNKNDKIIIEPEGRNTAPAITLAAINLDENDIMMVLPADHVIKNPDIFINSISDAAKLAAQDKLITFGIKPSYPHTGYGYIECGEFFDNAHKVKRFIEKPKIEKAEEYFNNGNFLWNSGMFMFKTKTFLDELSKYHKDIIQSCKKSLLIDSSTHYIDINSEEFRKCESISIDYALMEKTSEALVLRLEANWNDIGSWSSIWEISKKDENKNDLIGDIISIETKNSYIKSSEKLIATLGINNLVVVDTKDATLIANKDDTESIKDIVDILKKKSRKEHILHREVHRPWGKFDSIDNGDGFQVKRLTVYPKQKLSVQMHYHRSEHWVVVKGKARVHYGEDFHDLNVNESTYHDKEVVHALENITDEPCILIEVQLGDYLGEDDIVRYEDIYGRVNQDKDEN